MKDNLVSRLHRDRLGERGMHRKVFMESRWSNANKFYSSDLVSHYGCVNAIEFSHDGGYMVSAGDDRRVLLWNLQEALEGRGQVQSMAAEHKSNIFCLDTDHALTKIYSGGNDDQVIVHDAKTNELVDCFQHEEPVNGLSVHPHQPNIFLTACSDGRILMYDMRQPVTSEALMIIGFSYAFHSVQFNPVEPRLLVGANQKFGIGLYDVRKPRSTVLRYHSRSSMHARFNSSGTQIVGLRKRLPPVLFNIQDPLPACEFDNPQYYNSCTMKSCCFGGPRDQYIFSGSDDFNLYAWKIPEDKETTWVNRAHAVFQGHRSIVNQVRYNPHTQLLASSGVEKNIKVWSDWPFTSPGSQKGEESKARTVYTHEDYIGLVLRSDNLLHMDTQFRSTQENPRMMAFFDSLVQREIEGWDTEDDREEDASSENESSSSTGGGDAEFVEGGGVAGFSHRSIGRRSRILMERISVSIADDVMREERAIAEAQNTVGNNVLNTSNDSSGSGSSDIIPDNLPNPEGNLDPERESEPVRGAQPANASEATANNRIAQLISQKRGHLIKSAMRRGKRLRDLPDSVINKSIHHARKVLKISEPSSRSASTSDESSNESDDEGCLETQPSCSTSQPTSPPPQPESLKPSSSPSTSGDSSPSTSGASSRLRQPSTSSSESGDDYRIPGCAMMSSSPIPLSSVLTSSSPASPTSLSAPMPSSSRNTTKSSRSTRKSSSSTSKSSSSTTKSSSSATKSSSGTTKSSSSNTKSSSSTTKSTSSTIKSSNSTTKSTSSTTKLISNGKESTRKGLFVQHDKEEESPDTEDRDVDIAALLPSTSVNSRIKELRKRRLKIEKEEESNSDSN